MNDSNHASKGRSLSPDDLQIWKVETEIPSRFQAEVWQKIAARQVEQPVWSRFIEWITLTLVRPQFAAALILVAGLMGGGLAQWKVQRVNARSFNALQSQYIASVDPYAHANAFSGAEMRMP